MNEHETRIEQLKREIRYKEGLDKEYKEFQKILKESVDEFIKRKFKRLFNAIKTYATPGKDIEKQFEEIHEAWGMDCITDRTFRAIEDEWREYQDYSVARCVEACIALIILKQRDNAIELHELNKRLTWEMEKGND